MARSIDDPADTTISPVQVAVTVCIVVEVEAGPVWLILGYLVLHHVLDGPRRYRHRAGPVTPVTDERTHSSIIFKVFKFCMVICFRSIRLPQFQFDIRQGL